MISKRIAAGLAMMAAVLPGEVSAQAKPDPSDGSLQAEWVRQDNQFVCTTTPTRRLSPDEIATLLGRACLRMGPLAVGDEAKLIEPLLGKPVRTLAQPNDATALVFYLDQPGRLPYLAATVRQGRIVALQVSGPGGAERFSFNQIGLGATTDTLLQRFGRPLQSGPSGLKDTELWSYRPWTFSFEVNGGRVTSIRIAADGF